MDLHLELVGRELYGMTLFGAPRLSDNNMVRVKKQLDKSILAFKTLAKFSPYVAGDQFTMADCAAFCALPVLGMVTKIAYGQDLLEAHGVDYKPYMKLLAERPSVQRVIAVRKAMQTAMQAAAKA